MSKVQIKINHEIYCHMFQVNKTKKESLLLAIAHLETLINNSKVLDYRIKFKDLKGMKIEGLRQAYGILKNTLDTNIALVY